jgi:uncharacterized Zn ribbon protein
MTEQDKCPRCDSTHLFINAYDGKGDYKMYTCQTCHYKFNPGDEQEANRAARNMTDRERNELDAKSKAELCKCGHAKASHCGFRGQDARFVKCQICDCQEFERDETVTKS